MCVDTGLHETKCALISKSHTKTALLFAILDLVCVWGGRGERAAIVIESSLFGSFIDSAVIWSIKSTAHIYFIISELTINRHVTPIHWHTNKQTLLSV